jgi:hypothetical protein
MHVKELRAALKEIGEVFSAAGAEALEKDLAAVIELLGNNDDLELSTFLEVLKKGLAGKLSISSDEWLQRLKDAALDESAFLRTFADLEASACPKSDLLKITENYTGSKFKAKSSKQDLLAGIKSDFYGRIYDRDADRIAKRATPW